MKRFLLFLLTFAFGVASSLYAGSKYTVKVAASVTPTGSGTVYVGYNTTTQGTFATTYTGSSGEVAENTECKFYCHAKANEGYNFLGWSESQNASIVSTDNPYIKTIKATGDKTENVYAIFAEQTTNTITLASSANGSFTASDGTTTVANPNTLTTKNAVTLTATPASGYKVYRWYTQKGSTKTYFSPLSSSANLTAMEDIIAGVEFIPEDTPVFQIKGSTSEFYTDLNDAIAAVGTTSSVIVLISNGTLPAGNYTIAQKTTLLIPYDANYTVETTTPTTTTAHTAYSVYKKLKMASGANIIVNGAICVGGQQISTGTSLSTSGYGPGNVTGPYGCIDMSEGGQITLNNGSKLYAWGFITGQNKNQGNNTSGVGTIEALSGSAVYEDFVIANWRGGGNTACLGSDTKYKVFPFNNYFIPNIEVPLTIHYGATENVVSNAYMNDSQNSFPFAFISTSNGFFKLTSGASLKKWYDATTDYMCVEVNGNCEISSISLTVSIGITTTIKSSDFVLPIASQMDIRVESGTLDIPYDMAILPGAKLKLGTNATTNLSANLYMYDLDDWDLYALSYYYYSYEMRPTTHFSRTGWSAKTKLDDAKLEIDGTLNVLGKIYSTTNGANICGGSGGKVIFSSAPTASNSTYQVLGSGTATTNYKTSLNVLIKSYTVYCTQIPVQAIWLQNADGTHVETAGTAANTTYYYYRGAWTTTIPTTMPGDVNGDGVFDQADIDAVALAIVGRRAEVENFDEEVADVDNDGYITIIDLTQLVNQLKGR